MNYIAYSIQRLFIAIDFIKFTQELKKAIANAAPIRIAQMLTIRKLLTFMEFMDISELRGTNMDTASLIVQYLYARILNDSDSYCDFKTFLWEEESFLHLNYRIEKLG